MSHSAEARRLLVPRHEMARDSGVCRAAVVDEVVARCGPTAAAWAVETGRGLLTVTTRELSGCGEIELTHKEHELLELISLWTAVRLGGGEQVPAELAADLESVVRTHVERGFELDGSLTLIRIAHAWISRQLLQGCETLAGPDERTAAMRYVSDALFDAIETLSRIISRRYFLEREQWFTGLAARRRNLVQAILRGEPVDEDKATRRLGYDLIQSHLAVVLCAEDGTPCGGDLERVARRFLDAAGCSSMLLIPAGTARLWAWGGQPTGGYANLSHHPVPPHMLVATGLPSPGVAGMRLSHTQAVTAARIGSRADSATSSSVHEYRTLELVALLAADESAATDFVLRELGPLSGDSTSARVLRTTVKCYLDQDGSPSAAARHLHVAKNTVLYRIKKAEQLRGRALGENRLHLHAALHLAEVLGDAVLRRQAKPVGGSVAATA